MPELQRRGEGARSAAASFLAGLSAPYEPEWKRERKRRNAARLRAKAAGIAFPKLRTICLVCLDKIWVPEWAAAKAIPRLTRTNESVWLGRIAAKVLADVDRGCGGQPVVTTTVYRPCPLCGRPLLGEEAEARWELDQTMTGRQVPCGPECLETIRARKNKGAGNRE